MSNYKNLKSIIEKIVERGKIPEGQVADSMKFIRQSPDRIRDVDNFVNMRDPKIDTDSLLDYILENDTFRTVEDEALGSGTIASHKYLDLPIMEKYGKYMPKVARNQETQEILESLLENIDAAETLNMNNPLIKDKNKLEQLLFKLKGA